MDNNLIFADIQLEYKALVDKVYHINGILEYLKRKVGKFVHIYEQSEDCDNELLEQLESNWLYLEDIFNDTEKIIDKIEKVNIEKIKFLPKNKRNNIIKMDDYIILPDGYECDIFVDSSFKFDTRMYKHHLKPVDNTFVN